MTTTEKFFADIEANANMLHCLTRNIEKIQVDHCKFLVDEFGTQYTKDYIETVYEVIQALEEQRMKLQGVVYDETIR